MLITKKYAAINRREHERAPTYGTSGKNWAPWVLAFCQREGITTVLDYGCGKGTLGRAIAGNGLDWREYDPAIPGKDEPPAPAELVVCTDVMEHVEPDCTRAVLDHIVSLATRAVFLDVCCRLGSRRLDDGLPAHRNVHTLDWWKRKTAAYGPWDHLPLKSEQLYERFTAVLKCSPV